MEAKKVSVEAGEGVRSVERDEGGAEGVDCDQVMTELGLARRFHLRSYCLVAFAVFMAATHGYNFIFLAATVPYRCVVPECEAANSTEYRPSWLERALPAGKLDSQCARRSPVEPHLPCTNATVFSEELLPCDKWLYEDHNTIVAEFNLACQEWKRTMVGTVHNFGMLLSLPIIGYISDRWGRKSALVVSSTLVGVVGTLKAFSVSYEMYLLVELLETTVDASVYPTAYIYTVELLEQSKRVKITILLDVMLSLGAITFTLIVQALPYWRTFIITVYPPALIFIFYMYLLPESIRWLLSKGRKEKAVEIIMNAAIMNKVTLSDETMKQLTEEKLKPVEKKKETSAEEAGLWMQVLRSPIIMKRLAICSWWWITCTFVFYGLSINAVSMPGNKYVNYILVVSVEMISIIINVLTLDRFGRKKVLLTAYMACGMCLIGQTLIPKTLTWLIMMLYLLGRITIEQAFSGIYMYTSELFPTHARHSLLGFCSMVGRVGSIVAPQMPLLAIYVEWLPSVLFGACALVAGALMLTTPETLNSRLPDTIQEAELIAKRRVDTTPAPADLQLNSTTL